MIVIFLFAFGVGLYRREISNEVLLVIEYTIGRMVPINIEIIFGIQIE